ncbi:hypothetical protein [Streptomyces sp. NPDC001678]|uniref:hypothetical protein n=1 Tax=Streptomyces sp. NPDC001678 TaxID=3364599 RepID=UPI0036A7585B
MPAQKPRPGRAMHRLRDAVAALHRAAGEPSARKVSQHVEALSQQRDDRLATASHTVVREIFNGSRRTREDTLYAVVVALHDMSCGPRTETEGDAWKRVRSLWADAAREDLPVEARDFADVMCDALGRLGGDLDVISRRAGACLPDGHGDGVSVKALRAMKEGTKVPQPCELDALLRLLAEDGRVLTGPEHQMLMLSYCALLRACAPELHEQYLLLQELEARREYAFVLEDRDRRRAQELERHRAEGERLRSQLEQAGNDAALAHHQQQVHQGLLRWQQSELGRARREQRGAADGARRLHAAQARVQELEEMLGARSRDCERTCAAERRALQALRAVRVERDKLREQMALQEAEIAVRSASANFRVPPPPATPPYKHEAVDLGTRRLVPDFEKSFHSDPYAGRPATGVPDHLHTVPPTGLDAPGRPGAPAPWETADSAGPWSTPWPASPTPAYPPGPTAVSYGRSALPVETGCTELSDRPTARNLTPLPDVSTPPALPPAPTKKPGLIQFMFGPGTGRHARRR